MQITSIESVGKRFRAEPSEQRMWVSASWPPEHCAEAPRVVVTQQDAVAELQFDVVMGASGRRYRENSQAPGHPEMDDQGVIGQPEQKIFASPVHAIDDASDQISGQIVWNRPPQSAVVYPDGRHFLTFHVRRESTPGGFYFGKFGHRTGTES